MAVRRAECAAGHLPVPESGRSRVWGDWRVCLFPGWILGGNRDGFLPGGDGDVALFVDSDASFFQFFQDMDSMELEDEEGVVVDFESDHIDHGGNVFAGYGPVGAIAAHGEVAP